MRALWASTSYWAGWFTAVVNHVKATTLYHKQEKLGGLVELGLGLCYLVRPKSLETLSERAQQDVETLGNLIVVA